MQRDTHIAIVVAAFMGGFLAGMSRVFAVAFAPVPNLGAIRASFFQAGAGVIAAVIAGYYVCPAVFVWFHVTDDAIKGAISVAIGSLFWTCIPGLLTLGRIAIVQRASAVVGVRDEAQP